MSQRLSCNYLHPGQKIHHCSETDFQGCFNSLVCRPKHDKFSLVAAPTQHLFRWLSLSSRSRIVRWWLFATQKSLQSRLNIIFFGNDKIAFCYHGNKIVQKFSSVPEAASGLWNTFLFWHQNALIFQKISFLRIFTGFLTKRFHRRSGKNISED